MKKRTEGKLTFSPDVEVKGDVRFDPQSVFLCSLEYAAFRPLVVLQQLAVQKARSSSDKLLNVQQIASDSRVGTFLEQWGRVGWE